MSNMQKKRRKAKVFTAFAVWSVGTVDVFFDRIKSFSYSFANL